MKKPPKPKKKVPQNLSQKDKFIEYAREVNADESGTAFERTVKIIGSIKSDAKKHPL